MIYRRTIQFLNFLGEHPRQWVLTLCIFISLIAINHHTWQGDQWKGIISSDGGGYYAYLPAVFIYHDLHFDFYKKVDKKYHNGKGSIYFLNFTEGKMVDKYFSGEALLLLPFFLLACLLSMLFGYDLDGYSFLFQASVSVAALTYVMIGLHFQMKYLEQYVSKRIAAIAGASIFLGTNLFYFTTFQSSESHAFSFALIGIFIFFFDQSVKSKKKSSYYFLSFLFGLIVLTRPTNALFVLGLPFIAGGWKAFADWLIPLFRFRTLLISMVIIFLIVAIQSVLYKLQVDQWWINAYGDEHLHFDNPQFWNVLFSFRAGFFVWAPITFLSLIGWYWWFKHRKGSFWFWIFFVINTFVVSCWWAWHYEGTFGMRSLIDQLAWFVLLLAGLLSMLSKPLRFISYLFILAFIGIQQVQSWQRLKIIIPWGCMDKAKYEYLFLSKDLSNAHQFSDAPYAELPHGAKDLEIYNLNFDQLSLSKHSKTKLGSLEINAGEMDTLLGVQLNEKRIYGSGEWMVFFEDVPKQARMEVMVGRGEKSRVISSVGLIQPSPLRGEWHFGHLSFTNEDLSPSDSIFFRINNQSKTAIWLDDFRLVTANYE